MAVTLLLLAGLVAALGLVWGGPTLLFRGQWQIMHPGLALGLWLLSFAVGMATLVGTVLSLSMRGALFDPQRLDMLQILNSVLSWSALMGIGILVAVALSAGEPVSRAEREALAVVGLATVSSERRVGFMLDVCEDDVPYAVAFPGRLPRVAVSTGLERLLSGAELEAVLVHEYTHLRAQHGMLRKVAALNGRLLPSRRMAARMRGAVGLLIELAADDRAANEAGPATLANALARMGEATGNAGMLARAERLTTRRWRRGPRRRIPRGVEPMPAPGSDPSAPSSGSAPGSDPDPDPGQRPS